MNGLFQHYTGPGFVSDFQTAILNAAIFVLWLFLVVSWWKLFTKAGEKGWKALIPVYDFFVACKLTSKKANFWITILAILVLGVFNHFYAINAYVPRSVCMAFCAVSTVTVIVMMFVLNNHMAKAYGKSTGFALCLVLFPWVAYPVLGYGSAKYVGNPTKK